MRDQELIDAVWFSHPHSVVARGRATGCTAQMVLRDPERRQHLIQWRNLDQSPPAVRDGSEPPGRAART